MRSTLRPHERLRKPDDFKRARRLGRKETGRLLTLWACRRPETPPRAARLGIVVSRKNGIAVKRNLFKRRIRDIYRRNKADRWRGWDFVVAPKTGSAPPGFPASYNDLKVEFLSLIENRIEK